MFGIDTPELMVIAVVALIVIGPKELPGVLRSIGRWLATARNMASEFRGHVDDMMRQAELDDLKKQVEAGAKDAVLDLQGLDPTREIKAAIQEGASDAEKEMAAAKASIDAATAEAVPPPPVATAELTAPADAGAVPPHPDVTPANEATAANEAVPESETVPATPTPAGEAPPPPPPPSPPQKITVG